MTIGIAALCDDGKSCVVAADRMGVFGQGSLLEFKQDDTTRKIHKLDEQVVLLHSGPTQAAGKIASTFKSLGGDDDPLTKLDQALSDLLRKERETHIRRSVGGEFTYDQLMQTVTTTPTGPFRELWEQVQKIQLGDMLLVTPDESGYSIHFHSSPAFMIKSDLHYAAVGSGGIYARAALTIQQYTYACDLASAIFRVYSAKKAAELVYGVGEPTDMALMTREGFKNITQDTMAELEAIRSERENAIVTTEQTDRLKASLGQQA